MAIGSWWPIPIHRCCRCRQYPIAVGAAAPHPFTDFRQILDGLPHGQQVEAIGASLKRLLDAGVVKWDEIVTKYRVRTLREVVALHKISLATMEEAGVRAGIAKAAHAAVHTAEAELVRQHRAELIGKLTEAGVSQEKLVEELARGIAGRAVIAGGAAGMQSVGAILAAGQAAELGVFLAQQKPPVRLLPKPGPGAGSSGKPSEPKPGTSPKASGPPELLVSTHGRVAEEQVRQITDAIAQLPAPVREVLKKQGVEIAVTDRVSSFNPRIAGEQPAGWPPNKTFEHVGAFYKPDTKTIVVATNRKAGQTYLPLESPPAAARHEAGHAFDVVAGDLSHTAVFKTAYNKDVRTLSGPQIEAAKPILQRGERGAEEVFSEVFADMYGGGAVKLFSAVDFFPRCAELIQKWSMAK
jgi:hypothetical protein